MTSTGNKKPVVSISYYTVCSCDPVGGREKGTRKREEESSMNKEQHKERQREKKLE